MVRWLMAGALLVAAGVPALAADEMATDRPDFVESSDVVGKGRLQIETSVAGERDRADGLTARVLSTPTLLRLGVSEDLELRVETDGRLRSSVRDDATGVRVVERGWSDTAVGVKWHLRDGDEKTASPGIALLLHADLDSGSAAFRGKGVRPSARVVFEWELADDWSFGAMPGLFVDRNDDDKRYVGAIAAVTVGRDWLQGRLHGFVELAGQRLASRRNGGSVVTGDVGVSWKITPTLQVDAALFKGLNRDAPDLGWTTGLSVKF